MGLSSNTLWHQTKKGFLEKILKEKRFTFSYSKEKLPNDEMAAFPMISFCDLPFSEFADYITKYGGYSIGMSKDWGMRNGFNPVWYCNYLSTVMADLIGSQSFYETSSYIKPVEGELIVRGKKYNNYRYMDEREVRLIPKTGDLQARNIKTHLTVDEYETYKKRHKNSSHIPLHIQFEWDDIKYIIVQNSDNKDEFRELLKKLGCNNPDIHIYDSKQIKEDIIGIGHNSVAKFYLPENHAELMKLSLELAQNKSFTIKDFMGKLKE